MITWPSAFAGAFLGTYSHVFLDSVMHPDVMQFSPLNRTNPFLGAIGVGSLHLICFVLGLIGAICCARRTRKGLEL